MTRTKRIARQNVDKQICYLKLSEEKLIIERQIEGYR